MSTEQDKDSFSLKRNRGGEGGLDILGGPGVQLGSPDKKKRKASTQVPSFPPLSEYAPPPNTSSDHLIAANPFDDNYSSPSLKPPPPANPYISSYGPPRMALHRMPSPYGAPYQIRNQPFPQNPMGFSRTQRFNYAESPNYGQFGGGNNNMHFVHLSQMALRNLNQSSPGFTTEGNMSPSFAQQQNNFTQSRTPTPKQDPSETMNKSATQKPIPNPNCEEKETQENTAEKLNGVLHSSREMLKKSPDGVRRGNNNNNKGRCRSASSSSEPVFPCGVCLSEVNDDQEAILCEASCQKWFHRVCTGMTETAYNLLTAETSAVWGCDVCMEDKGAPLLKNRETPGTPSVPGEGQS